MKIRLVSLAIIAAFIGAFVIGPLQATAAPSAQAGGLTQEITGTFTDASGGTGTFTGTFDPARFVRQGGALNLTGTLTGTLVDSLGITLGTVEQVITLPAAVAQATCEILDLSLGPLDLDLLGLQVHLDEVNLLITAVPGSGNLLGNLLCAVARLLDFGGPLSGLVALLNTLLRQLG